MLKIKQLTKAYDRQKGIFDVTLTFEAGTVNGILGANGSGKTTLLRCVLGLLELQEGEVLLDGQDVRKQYDRVALISEQGSYLPYMNALEYGKFLSAYYHRFQLEEYLTYLTDYDVDREQKISLLSRGQQLKVELSAGFAMHADLLVLDEPFTTLDVYAKEDTVKHILTQFHDRQTILISTHNLEEIEHIIDRCVILHKGHVVKDVVMETSMEEGKDLRALLDDVKQG